MYVRAVKRSADARLARDRGEPAAYPVDAIFPVEVVHGAVASQRISRGFTVEPGDVRRVRRDAGAGGSGDGPGPTQGVGPPADARRAREFGSTELTTSSLMVADRLTPLTETVPTDRLAERPYVIGLNEITPAADRRFRRDEELIVVFLVYNPIGHIGAAVRPQSGVPFFPAVGAGRQEAGGAGRRAGRTTR